MSLPENHKAVCLHPAEKVIKVEILPIPKVTHPDDAIVKIKLTGLCGSDLHGYRGHEEIHNVIITGHEFVGEVVALGSSFHQAVTGRPLLYSTLKIGDKVVSPFTSSCGECQACRIGFTSRCVHQLLFGSEKLAGEQAQYVRVPKAGGTLFVVDSGSTNSSLTSFSDTSLLLLADILPTGCFAALQTVQHPKLLAPLTGTRYPLASISILPGQGMLQNVMDDPSWPKVEDEDRLLTIALVGLGPVGICALVSLLDLLSSLKARFRLVAVDLVAARKLKAEAVFNNLPPEARGNGLGEFAVASPDEAKDIVNKWTDGVGCNAVMEIVGNNPALALAYDLIRPFGVIVSAGVHQAPPVPLTGRQLYNKNVALEFGRCPVRTMFPMAVDLLRRRQDIFGDVGTAVGLIDSVVGLDEAPEYYRKFDKGECGKVIFDPWK